MKKQTNEEVVTPEVATAADVFNAFLQDNEMIMSVPVKLSHVNQDVATAFDYLLAQFWVKIVPSVVVDYAVKETLPTKKSK